MKDDFLRANPISLDPDIPLYQQLYTHLQTAVLTGDLRPGMRLPSTRALAILLNVSRHAVLNAYQQLIAEGYLDGMAGNGTFVAQILPDHVLTSPPCKDLVETSFGSFTTPFSLWCTGLALKLILNRPASEEIMRLLPAEQKIREAVYVAADRSAVWTVWNCDSQEVLDEVTKTLPLYEFWNIEATRLADEDF